MTNEEHNANLRRGVAALKRAMRRDGFPRGWLLGGGRAADGTETPYYVHLIEGDYRYAGRTVDDAVRHAVSQVCAARGARL